MAKLQQNCRGNPTVQFDHAGDEADELGAAKGWERASVTFRLTEERRRALLSLTPELGLRASPTAAIDFAIERAAGLGAASLPPDAYEDARDAVMDELHALLDACAALRADSDKMRSSLARIESRLAELGGAEQAADQKGSSVDEMAGTLPSLGVWLNREAGSSVAWAVVKARWVGARPVEAGKAMLRLDAWAAAPLELARQTASFEMIEAGPVRLLALSAFDPDSVGVLVCSRTPQGWIARIHALDAQGKLGPELDSFAA